MNDYPATEAPTTALIGHILARYHNTHRRELPELIALAHEVEEVHANDPNTPHGLTQALEAMFAKLEEHMRYEEETVLIPALKTGSRGPATGSLADLRDDHAGQEAALNRIAAITHGFRLPAYACGTWRRLYLGVSKLVDDLEEHLYLENKVLFPRLEMHR